MTTTALSKLTCPACGECFSTRRKLGNHWGRKHKGTILGSKVCRVCGKLFFPKGLFEWYKQVACSIECSIEIRRANTGLKHPRCTSRKVRCDNCGRSFLCRPSRLRRNEHVYCSARCAIMGRSKYLIGERAARWNGGRVVATCLYCGKECKPRDPCKLTGGMTFCSRVCFGKWKSENWSGANSPSWKGGITPERQRWMANGGEAWASAVRARSDSCPLCGERLPSNAHVHHILSFALYPEYRDADFNGLALCPDCHYWLHSNAGKSERLELERNLCAELGIMPRESLREQRQLCA